MRKALAPVAAAVLAGAGLYGALAAAERRLPPPADPWLDAWIAAGLKAEFRAETGEPPRHLLFYDARALFEIPELRAVPVRQYLVSQTSAQVLTLPDAKTLLEKFPEGRHLDYKLKPKGGSAHVCRVGRSLLLVSSQAKWIPFVGNAKTPKKAVEAMFDAFEDAVP